MKSLKVTFPPFHPKGIIFAESDGRIDIDMELATYLADEYTRTNARIIEVKTVLNQIANLFSEIYRQKPRGEIGWPYSWKLLDSTSDQWHKKKDRPKVSVSTQAMCCAGIESLIKAGNTHHVFKSECISETLTNYKDQVLKDLFHLIDSSLKQKKIGWESTTFGTDDIFTASWLLPLCSKGCSAAVRTRIIKILVDSTKDGFDHNLFVREGNEAGPHPLPLLRIIRAEKVAQGNSILALTWEQQLNTVTHEKSGIAKIETDGLKAKKLLKHAGEWFERNLHRQLSFYRFDDFRFDAAELVFCLAGALDTEFLTVHDPIILKVLGVIAQAQERSVYWRPYRPIMSDPRGGVLLPLSIEVATELLDVLRKTGTFHEYRGTLERYYEWLMSQKVMGQTEDGQRERANNDAASAGWHSENAYETNLVHVWDTARVAMFLEGYCDALVDEVQKQILESSKFRVEEWEAIEVGLNEINPFDAGRKDNIVERLKKFAEKPSFSILLYGPPGASKTTIARAVARHMKRRLVYLTPSDFISAGASAIEKSTKLMFEALTALRRVVIFFDEIDRLILDRDSEAYGQQGDIFQFMTPSMLAKFNDLRKTPGAVFLIATNFAERIDRAIKREGRIDQCILCLPFNQQGRTDQIKQLIVAQAKKLRVKGVNGNWNKDSDAAILTATRKTGLYVYEELKRITSQAAEAASDTLKNNEISWPAYQASITKAIKSVPMPVSEISVRSYKKRLQPTYPYPQKPFEEYARLLLLAAESDANRSELWIQFRDCLKNWKNLDGDDYSSKKDLLKMEAGLYQLPADWVNLI